jgi:hypothetical protein
MKLFKKSEPNVEFCDRCQTVWDAVCAVDAAREKAVVQALTLGPMFR